MTDHVAPDSPDDYEQALEDLLAELPVFEQALENIVNSSDALCTDIHREINKRFDEALGQGRR